MSHMWLRCNIHFSLDCLKGQAWFFFTLFFSANQPTMNHLPACVCVSLGHSWIQKHLDGLLSTWCIRVQKWTAVLQLCDTDMSSPVLTVPAVHPVVQPRESTVGEGRVVNAERKAWGSRGLACPPGPERISAFTQTGRLCSVSTSSSRATDRETTSRLRGERTHCERHTWFVTQFSYNAVVMTCVCTK